MKSVFLSAIVLLTSLTLVAQTYPDPEFTREVYYLKKGSTYTLVRLEKNTSKMENKTKAGGFGGSESGYVFDGDKSPVRLENGTGISFVYSTASTTVNVSPHADSVMRSNGADPNMFSDMTGTVNDPANMMTLYKVESGKGHRTIVFMKTGGLNPFGSHKQTSSDKYTFSVRKVRDGYYELVIDKTLPRGEYAFSLSATAGASAMGGTIVYAFAVD